MTDAIQRVELARLYDALSRFQWLRRRLRGQHELEGLEMHKRLAPSENGSGPGAGTAPINGWIWERVVSKFDAPRVLDIGCGFGATLFDWARRSDGGAFVGLTLSPYQARRATALARAFGLAERCAFRTQGYDDPIEGDFDVIVSIESLFHAADLDGTLRNLAPHLAPRGVLVLIEDMWTADDPPEESPVARDLLARWSTGALYTEADYARALDGGGLTLCEQVDWTDRVERTDSEQRRASHARLSRARRVAFLPSVRRAIDAFRGGLDLAALYADNKMGYRMLVAERTTGT